MSWVHAMVTGAMAQAAAEQLSHATLARSHEAAHRSLAELVERGRADGVFRTDVPPGRLTVSFFALIHACAREVHAGQISDATAPHILQATIRDIFTGPGPG